MTARHGTPSFDPAASDPAASDPAAPDPASSDPVGTLPLGLLELLLFRPEPSLSAVRDGALRSAQLADRLGYRRFWVPEHHTRRAPSTNPLTWLPVLGQLTQRLRIGTAVSLIRIRDPYLLAEDLATAAHFCRDRLDVGLGRGDVRGPGTEVLDDVRRDEAALDAATELVFSLLRTGNQWIEPPAGSFERWMHGAGTRSAEIAAAQGFDYCHALFFNPDREAARDTLHRHHRAHPDGRRAVAIALVSNDDRGRARADAQLQGIVINRCGTAEDCAELIIELLDDDLIDEVVINEQSADLDDHYRALVDFARLVQTGPAQDHQGPGEFDGLGRLGGELVVPVPVGGNRGGAASA